MISRVCFFVALVLGATSCHSGSNAPVIVVISPPQATLEVGRSQQFQASVTGANSNTVRWSVAEVGGGRIGGDGTYFAPDAPGTFHVIAASTDDPSQAARAEVVVTRPTETEGGTDAGERMTTALDFAADAGVVSGTVIDVETLAPIPGARIDLQMSDGQVTGFANDGGIFEIGGTAGRAILRASHSDYVPWAGEVGLGSRTFDQPLYLRRKSPAQTVDASGGTIPTGSVSLLIPAGAFLTPTALSATWIPADQLVASPGSARFASDAGYFSVRGVLHTEVATEPSADAQLKVPLPQGATGALALFELDESGNWSNPIAPTSMAADSVTFTLHHFSDYAFAQKDDNPPGVLIGWVSEAVDGSGARLLTGMELPFGSTVSTGANGGAKLLFPDGTIVQLGHDTTFTVGVPTDTTQEGVLPGGEVRVIHRPDGLAPQRRRLLIRTKTAAMGDRGTVFTVTDRICPDPKKELTKLEVTEGEVDATINASGQTVVAGQALAACAGCQEPSKTCPNELEGPGAFPLAYGGGYLSEGFGRIWASDAPIDDASGHWVGSGHLLQVTWRFPDDSEPYPLSQTGTLPVTTNYYDFVATVTLARVEPDGGIALLSDGGQDSLVLATGTLKVDSLEADTIEFICCNQYQALWPLATRGRARITFEGTPERVDAGLTGYLDIPLSGNDSAVIPLR